MLLSECLGSYIEKNKDYIKERTVYVYLKRKERLLKIFGDIDIKNFTQEYIQDTINKMASENTAQSSVVNLISLLKASLKPYKTFTKFKYSKLNVKEKEIYTQEEVKKIEEYILEKPKSSYTPILIAINTGMRLGEIIGLKFKDIDFKNGLIKVERSVWGNGDAQTESSTKTKNGERIIPLTDTLKEYLKNLKCDNNEFFVLTNNEKSKDLRAVQKTNKLLCIKLGIKPKGMHAYRHAFATRLLKNSQDFKSISKIMGHSNISITQNVYNHPDHKQLKNVIKNSFKQKENLPKIRQQQTTMIMQSQIEFLQRQINELNISLGRVVQFIQDNFNKSYKIY